MTFVNAGKNKLYRFRCIYDQVMGAFKVRLFKEDDLEKRIQLRVGALRLILIIFPKLDVIVEKYKNTNRSLDSKSPT